MAMAAWLQKVSGPQAEDVLPQSPCLCHEQWQTPDCSPSWTHLTTPVAEHDATFNCRPLIGRYRQNNEIADHKSIARDSKIRGAPLIAW